MHDVACYARELRDNLLRAAPLYLYEISTGSEGRSFGRRYVIAESEADALTMIVEGPHDDREKLKVNVTAQVLAGFVSQDSDEGLDMDVSTGPSRVAKTPDETFETEIDAFREELTQVSRTLKKRDSELMIATRRLRTARAEIRALSSHVQALESTRGRRIIRLAYEARGFASGFRRGIALALGWLR